MNPSEDAVSGHLKSLPRRTTSRRFLRGRAGFTLLETILAVSLSAVLLVLVGSAINLYSRIVSDRRSEVVNAQVARAVLQYMAKDIRFAMYSQAKDDGGGGSDDLSEGSGDGSGDDLGGGGDSLGNEDFIATADLTTNAVQPTPGLYGNAYELQVDVQGRFVRPVKYDTLAATGISLQSANLLSDPKTVTYYLRPSDPGELVGTPLQLFDATAEGQRSVLIRRVQSRAEAVYAATYGDAGSLVQGEQLLSDQIVSMTFAYFDGFEWLDEWDSAIYQGLPLAVQITIVVVDAEESAGGVPVDMTTDNLYQLTVNLPLADASGGSSSIGF
ncbi:MAG: hypothetical protein O7C67_15330 [Gammaproteobacteria bacterium]|nr:hypothetical protein [Gammaproteobacteria bacterium]